MNQQTGAQPSHHFPVTTTKDLAGRSLTLPQDLPGERTILLIAFQREQQKDIDTWVAGLHLSDGALPWLELPVINDPGAFGRWFIDSGMRRGIPDQATWQHVVTVYTRKVDLLAALGITDEKTIHVLVVDRQGSIIEAISGNFNQPAAMRLQAAIGLSSTGKR
jgi:hypothetical protein